MLAMDAEMVELLSGMLLGMGAVTAATFSAVAFGCGESKQKKKKSRRCSVSSKSKKRGYVSSGKKHGGSVSSKSNKSSKSAKQRHVNGKSAATKKRNGSSKSSKSSKSKSKHTGGKSVHGNDAAAARSTKSRRAGKSLFSSKISSRSSKSAKSASTHRSSKHGAAPIAKAPQQVAGGRQDNAKLVEVHVEPKELHFNVRGGQQLLKLYNGETTKRFAVKTKCSDNELYRLNPVYTFLEPGQKTVISTYRHAGTSKIDKLVFIVAEVGMDEVNPSQPFHDADANYPMMVVPLITTTCGGGCALAGPKGACAIVDRRSATVNEPARVLC